MRKKYLYRVVVDSVPHGGVLPVNGGEYCASVWVGQTRCYQTKAAADYRLTWLHGLGATGHIDRSDPITWGES